MSGQIRVLLVDDHHIMREGLKALLESDSQVTVVSTAGTAAEGLVKALGSSAHVAVIDLSLPDQDGLWLLNQIRTSKPSLPVIVLSMHADQETVLKAVSSGAAGYLTKSAEASELLTAIRAAHQGGSYLQPQIAPHLLQAYRRSQEIDPASSFSSREREVLQRVAEGQSNQDIADALFVSTSTVKAQLRSAFQKLNVSTRTEAVVEAMKCGLIVRQPNSKAAHGS